MSLKSKSNWILPKKKVSKDIVKYILKSRGIEERTFLEGSLNDIPSFEKLYDTKRAAKEIVKCIKKGKKIVIHGDYDSDGICSVSLLWEFLFKEVSEKLDIKVDVIPYIPSRVDQGYGLTSSSINDVLELGGQLLISVDCGVRDRELINEYRKEKGLEFVITDHHQPPEDLLPEIRIFIRYIQCIQIMNIQKCKYMWCFCDLFTHTKYSKRVRNGF